LFHRNEFYVTRFPFRSRWQPVQEDLAAPCALVVTKDSPVEVPPLSPSLSESLNNQSSPLLSSWPSSKDPFLIASIVLSSVVILLIVAIVFLLIKVRNLDKKPRIRRRVEVTHRSDADNNPPSRSVCEMIEIENCCNMNICETVRTYIPFHIYKYLCLRNFEFQ
jgi:hypothetical protein